MNWQAIEALISHATQKEFKVLQSFSVAGGSINASYKLEGQTESYFIKLNEKHCLEMFVAEAEGLAELGKPNVIRVPTPVCYGESPSHAFIVMENVVLSGGDKHGSLKLGEQLAKLHQVQSEAFGWHRDNTIGSTMQVNKKSNDWVSFYRDQRLQYQISLAKNSGCERELIILGDKLSDNLEAFFTSYHPVPSLLHGDFWSGNYAYDENSNPVIFDPAVYYGDREADIAMTELFGGFSVGFYDVYNAAYSLDDGYQVRKTLYNLYHILNHMHLFGGGYSRQAIVMMKQLLSEIS